MHRCTLFFYLSFVFPEAGGCVGIGVNCIERGTSDTRLFLIAFLKSVGKRGAAGVTLIASLSGFQASSVAELSRGFVKEAFLPHYLS